VVLAYALGPDTALSFVAGAPPLENLQRFLLFTLATSLGWDTGRALTNVVAIAVAGPAVPAVLRRAARRAAFDAPVVFAAVKPPTAEASPPGIHGRFTAADRRT
jgi:energy-coupling factor transport system substrate-specific component